MSSSEGEAQPLAEGQNVDVVSVGAGKGSTCARRLTLE
jgi:hypothetical protein